MIHLDRAGLPLGMAVVGVVALGGAVGYLVGFGAARLPGALLALGTGAAAVAAVSEPARLPGFVAFGGGASIVDPARRRTVFRMAPADRPMSIRLADYLAEQHPRIGLLADDSSYAGTAPSRCAPRSVATRCRWSRTSRSPPPRAICRRRCSGPAAVA